mmetsp:Transcript_41178/g.97596  ORF Transcript_41178/g.97596 Transcript_41178/m.97596 type:complete len:201 (+) Transcript_41178:1402-2004(+)
MPRCSSGARTSWWRGRLASLIPSRCRFAWGCQIRRSRSCSRSASSSPSLTSSSTRRPSTSDRARSPTPSPSRWGSQTLRLSRHASDSSRFQGACRFRRRWGYARCCRGSGGSCLCPSRRMQRMTSSSSCSSRRLRIPSTRYPVWAQASHHLSNSRARRSSFAHAHRGIGCRTTSSARTSPKSRAPSSFWWRVRVGSRSLR